MNKKNLSIIIASLLFIFSVKQTLAATLTLLTIGEIDVSNQTFTEWTYVGTNPILAGDASSSSQVAVQIDDATNTVVADPTGYWTFSPLTLTVGSHSVLISSATESISFTLHIASASTTSTSTESASTSTASATTSTSTSSSSTLPATGAWHPTIVLAISGMILIGLGLMSQAKLADLLAETD